MEIIDIGGIKIRKDAPELGVHVGFGLREYYIMKSGIPCPKFGTWNTFTYFTVMRFVSLEYCEKCSFFQSHKVYSAQEEDKIESIICGHAKYVNDMSRMLHEDSNEECETMKPISITKVEERYGGI